MPGLLAQLDTVVPIILPSRAARETKPQSVTLDFEACGSTDKRISTGFEMA